MPPVGSKEWREPTPLWLKYIGAAIFAPLMAIPVFWAFSGLLHLAGEQYAAPTIVAYVGVPVLAFIVAAAACYFREIVRTVYYPVLEVAMGLAAAGQAAVPNPQGLARLLALVAGIRIIVDGLTRFFKFLELKRK
jgi:hypothetical protein